MDFFFSPSVFFLYNSKHESSSFSSLVLKQLNEKHVLIMKMKTEFQTRALVTGSSHSVALVSVSGSDTTKGADASASGRGSAAG